MKFDVITFGAAVVDTFVDTDVAERGKFMEYPIGSKMLINKLRFDIGGGGTNTAVAFARFGLKTGFIGKIGKDNNGRDILRMMRKEKVRFLGKKDRNEKSGYSIILDSKGGERTILTYKGVNNNISMEDIRIRKLKTKWLYYSSLLETSLDTQVAIAKMMKKHGVKLAYNPSSYLTERKELIMPLLKLTDVLILNKEEAQMLAGKKEKDLLEGLYQLTKGIVVITDKDKKISAYDGKQKYYLIPHQVNVVERTGAGDAFASGFVAGQIVGYNIMDSLVLGLKEGESVLGHFGAKNNLIRLDLRKSKL